VRRVPLLLGFAVVLAGCGVFRPDPPDDALLILINRTEEPVHSVYLAPCASTDWGDAWTAPDEAVMPGRTRTFALAPGCWNLRAVLADGRPIEERSVAMTRFSQRTWALFPAAD